MTIYEPCNYASNVAYYHASTEICAKMLTGAPYKFPSTYALALGKGFSLLAMGSAFMHGSHTKLGRQQDNTAIKVISYLVQQAIFNNIPGSTSVTTDLSLTPRALSALQIEEDLFQMRLTMPVTEWYVHTRAVDVPHYYLSFAGVFAAVATVLFKPPFVDVAIPIFSDAFGMSEEFERFILDVYLPEVRNITGNQQLASLEKVKFLGNFLGTVGKIMYAFLWQENILTDNPLFTNEIVLRKGYNFLPKFNAIMNLLTTFEQFEQNFHYSYNIYPGEAWCNPSSPHAMWHTESAVGLLDFTYLGDELYRIVRLLRNKAGLRSEEHEERGPHSAN